MKRPMLVFILSISAFFVDGITLDEKQLIGGRISLIIEPGDQYLYNAAVDAATGSYFLPWTREEDSRAYGRLFGPRGGKIAPLQSFKGGTIAGYQRYDTHTRVVFNPIDQKYLVVWHSRFGDYVNGIAGYERRGQFVSSEGRAIGTSWAITKENILIQKLLYNSKANQYAYLYSIVPGDDLTQRIHYLQRLNHGGRLLGNPRKLNPSPGDLADAVDVDYDPVKSRYLVVWGPGVSPLPGLVKCRTVSADLETIGPIRTVEGTPATYTYPILLYDPYNKRHLVLFLKDNDIVIRAVSLDGTPLGTPIPLGLGQQVFKLPEFVAAVNSATGSILVGYHSPLRGEPIRLLRVDHDFARIGKPFYCTTQIFRTGLTLLYYNNFSTEFMAIWGYHVDESDNKDYFGQRVRAVPLEGKPER